MAGTMLGRRWRLTGIAVAAGILGTAGLYGNLRPNPDVVWREIEWPFLRDAWPKGRAFRCESADCNQGVEVYVRPKIGFCNCTAGVADDDEVDRVADLDLIGDRFIPVEIGQSVRIADMPGRARFYNIMLPNGTVRAAAGFAVARRCDLVVAVAQGKFAAPAELQRAALDLLSSGRVMAWLNSLLGSG